MRELKTNGRLSTSRTLFLAVVDAVPYGVFVFDERGDVVDLNRTAVALLGGSVSDGHTPTWSSLFPDLKFRAQASESAARGGFAPGEEGSLVSPDGSIVPAEVTAIETSDMDEIYIVAFVRDLRPNQRAQDRVRARERLMAIGETITALAHESRNALQRMQSCLTLIRARGNHEVSELADDMQSSQNQLQKLYDEIRHYASPMDLTIEKVDIRKLCSRVWRQLKLKWQGRDLQLSTIAEPQIDTTIDGDRLRLGQVLRNLLENAVDASPDGGRIEIQFSEVEIDGQTALKLTFKDAGPGIAEENAGRVFDLLFTTKREGTGMGLPIAKRIVMAHDGVIYVDQNESDGGAISVALPR